MEQHPVPQHISSYQFRLVGDMTLKQFFQLAGGVLISLLIYSAPFHPLIKWPLVIFFGILGIALAFLPFQERPLEHWIAAFFKAIYSPTIYVWKKTAPQVFFQPEQVSSPNAVPQAKKAYAPVFSKLPFFSKLEEGETTFLAKLSGLFGKPEVPVAAPAGEVPQATPNFPATPIKIPPAQAVAYPKPEKPIFKPTVVETQPDATLFQTMGVQKTVAQKGAQFSPLAAPPNPPMYPNLIVGQILGLEGNILENAIIEIRDSEGRPVRALKSNKVGHFMIVTPLSNGRYEMIIEKDGYQFEPVLFDAKGEIIPPIAIRAKTAPTQVAPATSQNANYSPI